METAALAYLIGFSAVYLVTVVVILRFAREWRDRVDRAEREKREEAVRRLARIHEADADVHDALAYQRRANEAARARIRAAERDAADGAAESSRNAEMLEDTREANSRLAAAYADSVDRVGLRASGVAGAAERARELSFSRARESTRLLRELERDLEALYSGSATPADVRAAADQLEEELASLRAANQEASDRFYKTVADLLADAERSRLDAETEISSVYATKEEAEFQAGELLRDVESAREEIDRQFGEALSAVEAAEAECGLRNSRDLDSAALDSIQASYDDLSSRLDGYAAVAEENRAAWDGVETRVGEIEGRAAEAAELDREVERALSELEVYIKSNCVPASSVSGLETDIASAAEKADAVMTSVEAAGAACESAEAICEKAGAECAEAQGAAAINIREGGEIAVEGAGTLALRGGVLEYCSLEGVCQVLAGSP